MLKDVRQNLQKHSQVQSVILLQVGFACFCFVLYFKFYFFIAVLETSTEIKIRNGFITIYCRVKGRIKTVVKRNRRNVAPKHSRCIKTSTQVN